MVNKNSEQISPTGDTFPHNPQSLPVRDMTASEARSAVKTILVHIESARSLIHDLYERRGWAALGFESWRECVVVEFEQSKSNLYRQLDAARIEAVVAPDKPIGKIPERKLRPLAGLTPEKQKEAWDRAKASSEGDLPTNREVKAAVAEVAPKEPRAPKPEPIEVQAQRAAGIIPEDAVVEITEPSVPIEREPAEAADDFLPDDEWLAAIPARELVAPNRRKRFDADALAFRRITPHRQKYVFATRAITKAQRTAGGGLGAWLGRHLHYLTLRDPSQWSACKDCKGTGAVPVVGECPRCKGNGYAV